MSYNVCIHQSLRKRIVDEVDDSMKRFTNNFDQLLSDLEETHKLFQLDDCQLLMEKGDDPPYCQMYRDVFRTLYSGLYDIWDQFKNAMVDLYPLREKTNVEKKPISHAETADPDSSVQIETPRECVRVVTLTEQEVLPIYFSNT